jgi:hypothetical protein
MFSKNFGEFFFGCTEMKRIERGEGDLAQPWFVAHETILPPAMVRGTRNKTPALIRGTRNNFLYCKLALTGSSGRNAF